MHVRVLQALALSLVASPALALGSLTLDVVGIDDPQARAALDSRLENGSLLFASRDEKAGNDADLFGAALADYRRLIGVLYNEGYYGPAISIRIDGREAADIDPFRPPTKINTIAIVVDPGPIFTFGLAQVGPRAPTATANPIVPVTSSAASGTGRCSSAASNSSATSGTSISSTRKRIASTARSLPT